jgi:hypothetical protein
MSFRSMFCVWTNGACRSAIAKSCPATGISSIGKAERSAWHLRWVIESRRWALASYPGTKMAKTNGNESTQETQPKEGPPAVIPIPTRGEVFRDLEKVAKPRKGERRPMKGPCQSRDRNLS